MEYYRSQVLICTGTGCSSSNSPAIIKRFEECIRNAGLEKEVKVCLLYTSDAADE